MLELGKAGSAGTQRGVIPVLDDGAVVAALHGPKSSTPGTATVGTQTWVMSRTARELAARRAGEPEHTIRMRAHRESAWRGLWAVDLEGTPVEVTKISRWKSAHRYVVGDRVVADGGSTGGVAPRVTLTAEPGLPVHHQVFLLWLESVLRSGSGGGSGAVFSDGGDDGGGDGGGGGGD